MFIGRYRTYLNWPTMSDTVEFPTRCSGLRILHCHSCAQVQSLAQELPHAANVTKKKKGGILSTKVGFYWYFKNLCVQTLIHKGFSRRRKKGREEGRRREGGKICFAHVSSPLRNSWDCKTPLKVSEVLCRKIKLERIAAGRRETFSGSC